jgi:hypothetical protein
MIEVDRDLKRVPAGWWESRLQRQYVPAARPVPRARYD